MMGEPGGSDEQRGLCARALRHIFRATRSKKDQTVTVQVSPSGRYDNVLLAKPEAEGNNSPMPHVSGTI